MRESSFVCCCLRMSTFWVNYSVSVIYCSNPALLWVSGRSPYACMQPIFSGCFQRWLCFHTTILYLSIFISENISQHLFSYCSSSYGLWKNYNPTHVTSSPQHPPPLHGASSQGSAWSNASLLRTSWNCATFICYDWQTNKGNISVTPKWLQRETKQLSVKTLF